MIASKISIVSKSNQFGIKLVPGFRVWRCSKLIAAVKHFESVGMGIPIKLID